MAVEVLEMLQEFSASQKPMIVAVNNLRFLKDDDFIIYLENG